MRTGAWENQRLAMEMEAASRVVFSQAVPISMGDTCISAIALPLPAGTTERDEAAITKAAEHETDPDESKPGSGEAGGVLDLDIRHAENAIPDGPSKTGWIGICFHLGIRREAFDAELIEIRRATPVPSRATRQDGLRYSAHGLGGPNAAHPERPPQAGPGPRDPDHTHGQPPPPARDTVAVRWVPGYHE